MLRRVIKVLPVLAVSALEALSCGKAPSEDCSIDTTPLRTELVCPDTNSSSESCNHISVSSDDRLVMRQVSTILNDPFGIISEDVFDRNIARSVFADDIGADTWVNPFRILRNGNAYGFYYYSVTEGETGHFVKWLSPEQQTLDFSHMQAWGFRISPSGQWIAGVPKNNDNIIEVMHRGEVVQTISRDTVFSVSGIANNGAMLLYDLYPGADVGRQMADYYLQLGDRRTTIATGKRGGCGTSRAISADGSTVVLSNLCEPTILFRNGTSRPVAPPSCFSSVWSGMRMIKGMSANGRTMCFAVNRDYLIFDSVRNKWHNIADRYPLLLQGTMNMPCEVASENGIDGGLYFADRGAGMYAFYRVDLADVLGNDYR